MQTRVAIIGAGPAGATTACLLARKGASVAIFDDGRRPDLIVGESLVPLLTAIFQRMGIEEQVRALGIRKPGVTFTFDGGDDFALSFAALQKVLPNYAYNVPRKEFDTLILETAKAAGAVYLQHAAKLEADTARDEVLLAGETLALVPEWKGQQPDYIIDASGRRRLFARLMGVEATTGPRRDVSHFAHYVDCARPDPEGQVIIGRLQHGWSWRIPLPGDRLSVGVVMNNQHARELGATPEEQLERAIDEDAHLSVACAKRSRVSAIATYANYQLISERGSGAGWAMVGDSFGFVDPMLSPGLCMAMSSAERLAEIIPAQGGRSPNAAAELEQYVCWFRDMLTAWQHFVDYFYDGRIFAIHRSGSEFSRKNPGRMSNFLERHAGKHLSGMASGAFINKRYSQGLLRFLERHLMRYDPSEFAIR